MRKRTAFTHPDPPVNLEGELMTEEEAAKRIARRTQPGHPDNPGIDPALGKIGGDPRTRTDQPR